MFVLDKNTRILLLEDDDGDADLLIRSFDKLGREQFEIERASSLAEGLEVLQQNEIDVVLLDLSLPDSHGFETITSLVNAYKNIPIVILTSIDDEAFALQAQQLGAQDYLVKGHVDRTVLPRVLRYAIERKRAEVELERARAILETRVDANESALQKSREIFRVLVEGIPDYSIIMLSKDGIIETWNKGAQIQTGYEVADIIGKPFWTFYPDSEKARTAAYTALGEVNQHGRSEVRGTRVRKDGTTFFADVVMTKLTDPASDRDFIAKITRDITAITEAQAQALQAGRLAAVGQMVAGLAHESRNALQRIQSIVNQMLRRTSEPALLKLISGIESSGDELRSLYQTVREYSSPLKLELDRHNIKLIWNKAWDKLEHIHSNREIEFIDASSKDFFISVDRFRIEQVFRNIFENSLAATDEPLKISVSAEEVLEAQESKLKVYVRDNGPGFDEKQLQKIFEPFFTTKVTGTGLGMAISKRILEAHSGEISAQNIPSGGGELCLTIPTKITQQY